MLSPAQLQQKLAQKWLSFAGEALRGDSGFPLRLSLALPQGKILLERFHEVSCWIQELRQWVLAHNFELEETTIRHRQLGGQNIPIAVIIPSWGGYLNAVGKADIYNLLESEWFATLQQFPDQRSWWLDNVLLLEKHLAIWPQIRSVLTSLRDYRGPAIYLRQLSIPDIDSKFIERHRSLLNKLLSAILPEDRYDADVEVASTTDFCRKFGFKYDEPLLRFRWLDLRLAATTGALVDLTLPVATFAALNPRVTSVFITENKINGLCFPVVPNALVIFGLGYGLDLLKQVPWLKDKNIIYWGDIDTHGFAMLSRLRRFQPQTKSLLMDEDSLHEHRACWVREGVQTQEGLDSGLLTDSERALCMKLLRQTWGEGLRLEQESVRFDWLEAALKKLST